MRTERIVRRQNLREKYATLKSMVVASEALVRADRQLRMAWQAGYKHRVQEEIQESKEKEAALKGSTDQSPTEQSLNPGNNAQQERSTQEQEQPPVS